MRLIEVKSWAGVGPVFLTTNASKTAQRLRGDYWLVFDCATCPRLISVQAPVRLGWEPIVRNDHYQIWPERLEDALWERKSGHWRL